MAATAPLRRVVTAPGSDARAAVASVNAIANDLDALRTTIAAIITAAATNIGAVAAVSQPAAITAFQVKDGNGTVIADDAR